MGQKAVKAAFPGPSLTATVTRQAADGTGGIRISSLSNRAVGDRGRLLNRAQATQHGRSCRGSISSLRGWGG